MVRRAGKEPQQILNRERLVAAFIDGQSFQEFEAWRGTHRGSLALAFGELRRICAEENYRLKLGSRRNRRSPFRVARSSR